MSNVTLSINDNLLRAGREYAKKHNISFNELIRQMLENRIKSSGTTGVDEMFRLMDIAAANSNGVKWNRADLYER
jgi:hypothetical protein